MVELFARRRRARHRVLFSEYCAVHRELIGACRSLAAASKDEQRRAFYEELEALAKPWLTPNVLVLADREIVFDLLIRCRQAERKLGGKAWLPAFPDWAPRLLFTLAGGGVIFAVLARSGRLWFRMFEQVQSWSDTVWFFLIGCSDLQKMCLVTLLVTLVSIGVVSRAARS